MLVLVPNLTGDLTTPRGFPWGDTRACRGANVWVRVTFHIFFESVAALLHFYCIIDGAVEALRQICGRQV